MKKVKNHNKIKSNFLFKLISASIFVTYYIDPEITDPINSPKMWALIAIGAWLIPYLVYDIKTHYESKLKDQKLYLCLCLSFVFLLFVSALQSDVKYRAFFGEVQRRNGFLTYLGLVTITLSAALLTKIINIPKIYIFIGLGLLLLSLYGLAQHYSLDLISWNNPYNSVIGTLGNPNFMGAVLAVLGVFCFSGVFLMAAPKYFRISLLAITVLSFIVIIYSNARQGLISFAIGIIFCTCFLVYFKHKLLGFICAFIAFLAFIFSLFGMLQIGPLTSYLYKDSVTLRGYYWHTGIKMFIEHPIFGVGLDNYGNYFNEYRDISYPIKYGFSVSSNNAHNVPIQLFATAGLLIGIIYLIITLFVIYVGVKSIFRFQNNLRVLLIGLTSAFLTFQSQSIVSIDNIGISVWGWLFGGLIIGTSSYAISLEKVNQVNNIFNTKSTSIATHLFSWLFLIASLILIATLYQGEKNSFKISEIFGGTTQNVSNQALEFTKKSLDTKLIEPSYKLSIAINLYRAGEYELAINTLNKLLEQDSRNLNYLEARASLNELLKQTDQAISDRNRIALLNPGNGNNFYKLSKNYIISGNFLKAQEIVNKLNSYASTSDVAKQATQELKNAQ